jgi:hypothetical protein
MNFITGKHLSRRTFLRSTGASVALPLLDSMVPAGRAWRDPAQESFTRLVCVEESMGCAGGNDWGDSQHLFAPSTVGRDFEFLAQSQLKPLEPYREYLTIVSQTDCRMAEPFVSEEIGGDHDRSTAVFLTQSHPLQTKADVFIGKSLDQVHAERFGQDTVLPSLEVTTEEMDRGGGCAYNYHCAYTTSLAWKSPTEPLPAIREPRVVFEQLFGAGSTPADRAARLRANKSLLDWVTAELRSLRRELGAVDRQAVDQYTTNIRELERRIQLIEAQHATGEERAMPEAPTGIPDLWEDHMELMFDLQVLALQGDLTRVITFKTGFDLQNRTLPASGTNKSFHGASHHGNVQSAIMEFNLINTYRLSRMTYFLEKMKNAREGDASLLDKTAIVWGSPMGDPNLHNHRRCPLILMGHANGALEGNLHLRAPTGTPMANVFVSLMQAIGHDDLAEFGDSTGAFPLYFPKGQASNQQSQGAR